MTETVYQHKFTIEFNDNGEYRIHAPAVEHNVDVLFDILIKQIVQIIVGKSVGMTIHYLQQQKKGKITIPKGLMDPILDKIKRH